MLDEFLILEIENDGGLTEKDKEHIALAGNRQAGRNQLALPRDNRQPAFRAVKDAQTCVYRG